MTTPSNEAGAVEWTPVPAQSALTELFRTESRLLQELLRVMERQREAVGKDDLEVVEETVFAIHRVLHTLGEAQRRRRSINRNLGEREDLSLRDLEAALGSSLTPELRDARDELEGLAHRLAREVDVNRRILRGALASGEDLVRNLRAAPQVNRVSYSASAHSADPEHSGALIVDRVV